MVVSIVHRMLRRFRSGSGRALAGAPIDAELPPRATVDVEVYSGDPDDVLPLLQVRRSFGPPFVPVGDVATSDDGSLFFATTPCTGRSLWAIAARTPAPAAVAVRIGQLCLLAHEILHDAAGALPPAAMVSNNLPHMFVELDGFVACAGPLELRGASKLCGGGTLRYVAPESLDAGPMLGDFRWGQFSAGAFVVELVSGEPFWAAGESELARRENMRAYRLHRPIEQRGIVDALVPILVRMTARDPGDRYATLVAAREALDPFAGSDDDVRAWLTVSTPPTPRPGDASP